MLIIPISHRDAIIQHVSVSSVASHMQHGSTEASLLTHKRLNIIINAREHRIYKCNMKTLICYTTNMIQYDLARAVYSGLVIVFGYDVNGEPFDLLLVNSSIS